MRADHPLLVAARKRNRLRLIKQEQRLNPSRYLVLGPTEARTLAVRGALCISRKIAPKHWSLKNWQCPYGRAGTSAWIHEPVRWWGTSNKIAFYRYANDPDWSLATPELGWQESEAKGMSEKARRFIVLISDVKRSDDGHAWLLEISRLDR